MLTDIELRQALGYLARAKAAGSVTAEPPADQPTNTRRRRRSRLPQEERQRRWRLYITRWRQKNIARGLTSNGTPRKRPVPVDRGGMTKLDWPAYYAWWSAHRKVA